LFWIAHAHGVLPAAAAFVTVLLCFGGIFAIAPAVMADFFGTRFFGEDYSLIITAAALAGIVGPLFAAGLEDAFGSLTAWLTPISAALLLAAIIPFFTREPVASGAVAA
jgi:OFA family oxalate/formate antiporter-like MFS transporter